MSASRRSYEETAHRRVFGERVRDLRKQRGWTQEDLAERADLRRTYVSGIESGQRNPTLDVIVRLANAFHQPVVELFQ